MSLSLNGAFYPTILPLFQGSRRALTPVLPMMVSHGVEGHTRCADSTSGPLPWVNPNLAWTGPVDRLLAPAATHAAGQNQTCAEDACSTIDPALTGVGF